MEQHHAEMMAVSLAGHDKGRIYVVLKQEGDFLYLADGNTKLLDKPKRKKEKHVQLIKHLSEEIGRLMNEIETDADLRKIVRIYRDR